MIEISKAALKAKILAYFRHVEETGESVVITDRGRPVLEIRRFIPFNKSPEKILENSIRRMPGED